ncbi:MAG: alpha-L-fucosidase [Bacteroidales bacterium]
MKIRILQIFLLIEFQVLFFHSSAQSFDENLKNWQDHKFSMFIHWGLYSVPAGVWHGSRVDGYSEQIQGHARISKEEYGKLAATFNPVFWNPDSVAFLAKNAGMRSIVITSKHHDGFSMFHTRYSKYNVVDSTPYKRDIIGELSESCRKYGLKFGVYFSLIDWNYPGALPFTSTKNSDSIPPAHHQFNLKQLEELLTNYGEISEIWFDMGSPTYQQSKELRDLIKRLQPNCLINGRIWNNQGDFAVMGDNSLPKNKMGVPWQTPASMFEETWGYRSWQNRGSADLKFRDKLEDLIKVVSLGGNFLLNISPTGEGRIVPFEKEVLLKMGKWLDENGEAIYNTRPVDLQMPDWGYMTQKPGKIYLHIFRNPIDNNLVIKGLNSVITNIHVLNHAGKSLAYNVRRNGLNIDLKDVVTADLPLEIVIEYSGALLIESKNLVKAKCKRYELTTSNAENYYSYSGHDYYSNRPVVVKKVWCLADVKAGKYKLKMDFSSESAGTPLLLIVDSAEHEIYPDACKKLTGSNLLRYELIIPNPNSNTMHVQLFNSALNPTTELTVKNLKISILAQ